MNGRDLIQPSGSIAAVVNAFLSPSAFQIAVGHIRPCCPPRGKLPLAVPAFGDGILPAVAGAFRMLTSPDEPLRLGGRWCHIDLLFADLVGILLLPALCLCYLKFSGGKTSFLTVFGAKILFLGFVLPLALLIQRARRQQNVGVGIVTVGVVDGSVGAHSIGYKLLPDKILKQLDLFLTAQLYGQGNHKLPRQPAVLSSLHFLYGVPEFFTILPFLRCIFRQENLLPDKPLFFRVVMLYPVVVVVETGTAQISGGGHSGASCAPADHLHFQMINRHIFFTSFFLFLFLFRKRENDPKSSFGS